MRPILPLTLEPSDSTIHRRAQVDAGEPSLEADAAESRQMPPNYSPHLIAQASRVAQLLDEGYSNRRIAAVLCVSNPRVAQIRKVLPQLAPYIGPPDPLDRLRGRRDQLWSLRRQALQLAATIRRDLRELEEELQAASVDALLGFRR